MLFFRKKTPVQAQAPAATPAAPAALAPATTPAVQPTPATQPPPVVADAGQDAFSSDIPNFDAMEPVAAPVTFPGSTPGATDGATVQPVAGQTPPVAAAEPPTQPMPALNSAEFATMLSTMVAQGVAQALASQQPPAPVVEPPPPKAPWEMSQAERARSQAAADFGYQVPEALSLEYTNTLQSINEWSRYLEDPERGASAKAAVAQGKSRLVQLQETAALHRQNAELARRLDAMESAPKQAEYRSSFMSRVTPEAIGEDYPKLAGALKSGALDVAKILANVPIDANDHATNLRLVGARFDDVEALLSVQPAGTPPSAPPAIPPAVPAQGAPAQSLNPGLVQIPDQPQTTPAPTGLAGYSTAEDLGPAFDQAVANMSSVTVRYPN